MRRPRIEPFLEAVFRIRSGEALQVGLMFAYLMSVVSTSLIGRTVRDTLFLSRYGPGRLPAMYLGVAVGVALSGYAYGRVAARAERERLTITSLALFTAVTLAFWILLRGRAGPWVYPLLYIVIEIIGSITMIQFWTFANDLYSAREAKRLFGVIGAGAVLANLVCGFGVGSVAPFVGSENLLVFAAALLAVSVGLVRKIESHARGALEPRAAAPAAARPGEAGPILDTPHLKLIAALVVFKFVTVNLVDYQFKVIANREHTEAELAAFLGCLYGFTGLASSFVQFFATSRVLERAGVVVSLATLPAGLLLGSGLLLAEPAVSALVAVTIAKATENVFRFTLYDAAMQLLYVPVPSRRRTRAKAFIDGILKPVSVGAAGLVLVVLAQVWPADRLATDLAYLDVALAAGWLAAVVAVRRAYVRSIAQTLATRRLDLGASPQRIRDEVTVQALEERLRSADERHVLHALELISSVDADFEDELLALLGHASDRVRIEALKRIGESGRLEIAIAISSLLSDPDETVRAAAVGAYGRIGRERATRVIAPFLSEGSVRVRGAAVAALIQHGGLDGSLAAGEALRALLGNPEPALRRAGARVLEEIRARNLFNPALELLQDRDPSVRIAAIEAAGAMQSPELIPALVYKLADDAAAPAAVRALTRYGAKVERTLVIVLENEAEDLAIRRKVPRVLAQVGRERALDAMMAALSVEDDELQIAVARATARLRERSPRLVVDEASWLPAFETALLDAYQALAALEDLGLPAGELLAEALEVRHRAKLALAFRLLEIAHPSRMVQLAYANLDADSKAARANALELVDNLVSKEIAGLLLPLLDDQPRAQKVRRGAEIYALERASREAWIARLLDDPHPWIVACTLHLLEREGGSALAEPIARHLASPDPIVRESACLALAAVLRRGASGGSGGPAGAIPFSRASTPARRAELDLARLLEAAATDETPAVRRASRSLRAVLALGA